MALKNTPPLYRTKHSDVWEEIRTLYIFGKRDPVTDRVVYPSQKDLSKEFDIPATTIAGRAAKHEWLTIRRQMQDTELVETRKRIAEDIIMTRAELNMQDLIIHDAIVQQFAEDIEAGRAKISTSEGLKALGQRRQIYNEIHGVEQGHQSVDVKVEIDINAIPEDELQHIFDKIISQQLRDNSVQAEFTENTTDAEDAA